MIPLAVSTLVLVLVAAGVLLRRRTGLHWRLMLAAFALDLGLVLYLEGSRGAVETAARSVHPVVWIHAGVSTLVLVLWVTMLRLGWLVLQGNVRIRRHHRMAATVFLALRVANYATAFALPTAEPPMALVQDP